MRVVLAAVLAWVLVALAQAQHNHFWFHDVYLGWVSNDDKVCCNQNDCGRILDTEQRTVEGGHLEVFVKGVGVAKYQEAWCPVLSKHYLKTGLAAGDDTAHICVSSYYGGMTPCAQFICYQPKPLF